MRETVFIAERQLPNWIIFRANEKRGRERDKVKRGEEEGTSKRERGNANATANGMSKKEYYRTERTQKGWSPSPLRISPCPFDGKPDSTL